MRLRFTPKATQDLTEIANYIRGRNRPAAQRVRAGILAALQTLVLFPDIGRRQNVHGVRKIAVRRYPYLIYYVVDWEVGEIVVLTIRHAARRREFDDI